MIIYRDTRLVDPSAQKSKGYDYDIYFTLIKCPRNISKSRRRFVRQVLAVLEIKSFLLAYAFIYSFL